MKVNAAFFIGVATVGVFGTTALAGEWSTYKSCDDQFISDRVICQKVATAACWKSQNERLATCNGSSGKTLNWPLLAK